MIGSGKELTEFRRVGGWGEQISGRKVGQENVVDFPLNTFKSRDKVTGKN